MHETGLMLVKLITQGGNEYEYLSVIYNLLVVLVVFRAVKKHSSDTLV